MVEVEGFFGGNPAVGCVAEFAGEAGAEGAVRVGAGLGGANLSLCGLG